MLIYDWRDFLEISVQPVSLILIRCKHVDIENGSLWKLQLKIPQLVLQPQTHAQQLVVTIYSASMKVTNRSAPCQSKTPDILYAGGSGFPCENLRFNNVCSCDPFTREPREEKLITLGPIFLLHHQLARLSTFVHQEAGMKSGSSRYDKLLS